MSRENHTLKRALTDPHILSGIGNAYSDEILHRAKLSPLKQTKDLSPDEWARLHDATVEVLSTWTERLRVEARVGLPRACHRLPPRDGRARAVRAAVPGVRHRHPAYLVRR